MIAFVPYVRTSGLGLAVWVTRHRWGDLVVGTATALVVCALDWRRGLVALALVALTGTVVTVLARRRIGGATGDVYGATAELCQMAALLVFAVR
jgi:adenosylcobinamide-GDP ribazoletransferase